ncbi:MAG: LptA/OstA family protein [Desulfatibacillaceae bacterium]|nr:LptA/OstA family protein [Desulfatibacillaceae bacterium]
MTCARIPKILLLAAALFLAPMFNGAMAQGQPSGFAFSDAPLNINSDSLVLMHRENSALFSGNVVAVQEETTLKADELALYFDAQTGPDERSPLGNLKTVKANGSVIIQTPDYTAWADRASYDADKQQLVLTGEKVTLKRGENTVTGKKITVDTPTGITKVDGGPVRVDFFPGSP